MPPSKVTPLEITDDEVVRSREMTVKDIIGILGLLGSIVLFYTVVLCILFGLLALLAAPFLFFDRYIMKTDPCLSIESIVPVTPINVSFPRNPSFPSAASSITGSWNVSFGLYNRDHVKITYYDSIDVTLYYSNVPIGRTSIHISKIHQGKTKTWIHMATRINTKSARLDDVMAYGLVRNINQGTIKYAVSVVVHARIVPNRRFGRISTLQFDTRLPRPFAGSTFPFTIDRSCTILPR